MTKVIKNKPLYRETDETEHENCFLTVRKCVSCGTVSDIRSNKCQGCKQLFVQELSYAQWEAHNTKLQQMKEKIKEDEDGHSAT